MLEKPRRVRTRRCEKNGIRFFRRRVRREKHFSARKRAYCPLKADSACAQRVVALFGKVALPLFRKLKIPPDFLSGGIFLRRSGENFRLRKQEKIVLIFFRVYSQIVYIRALTT